MKQLCAVPLIIALAAQPVLAQEQAPPPSLMERGAQMFLEGLMDEMAPTLEGLSGLMEEAGPALQNFMQEMGPKLRNRAIDTAVYAA